MTKCLNARLRQFTNLSGNNWAVGKQLLQVLGEWAASADGSVLDYGCGESPFRHLFTSASSYIRMDVVDRGAGCIVVDGTTIPVQDSSIGCVILSQVLGDIPDQCGFFLELCRVVKPAGQVIVFETTCYPEHDPPHDYFRIMPEGIRWLANGAGFIDFEVVRIGGLFTRFAQLWNTCVMGGLDRLSLLRPLAMVGIVCANLGAYVLDRSFPHPLLATDYAARFVKPQKPAARENL